MLQLVTELNTLDYLLVFILFLGIVVGLIRGTLPQLISVASIWLGLLASLWLYRPLSNNILQGLGFAKTGSDAMAFFILLIVFFNAIRLIVKALTVPPEEKKQKPRKRKGQVGPVVEAAKTAKDKYILGPLGALGGMAMGLVLTTLWVALILGVLQFVFQVDVTEAAGVSVPGSGLVNQLKGSTLVAYFNRVLWLLVRSVSFFVIDSGPNILEVVINRVFPAGG